MGLVELFNIVNRVSDWALSHIGLLKSKWKLGLNFQVHKAGNAELEVS